MSERQQLLGASHVRGKFGAALRRDARAAALAAMSEEEQAVVERASAAVAAAYPKVGRGVAGEILAAMGALFDEVI